jgi:hypothetical protein
MCTYILYIYIYIYRKKERKRERERERKRERERSFERFFLSFSFPKQKKNKGPKTLFWILVPSYLKLPCSGNPQ